MRAVSLTVTGVDLDFELGRQLAEAIAARDNPETMLISWADRARELHSPQCVKCEIGDRPGWEVYGRNHGGRLRIDLNGDALVFIFS